ncbi:MAG: transposase [Leptolyngbya sp.]|nr:MAG: transposase [Leptolyngbya sp.]
MAPKKLTEADKTSILSLYRQPQETTSTLAERYAVSNSTISRLLKASLPEAEYSVLIQQKRGSTDRAVVVPPALPEAEPALPEEAAPTKPKARPRSQKKAEPEPVVEAEPVAEPVLAMTEAPETEAPATEAPAKAAKPARKRRSRAAELLEEEPEEEPAEEPAIAAKAAPEPTQLSLPDPADPAAAETPEKPARPVLKSAQAAPAKPTESPGAEAALDDDWDDAPVLGDDYDDDDSDSDDEDDDEAYAWESSDRATTNLEALEISPLTAEALPSLCYVVVERTSSELVVLPLSTFAELGQIPESEGDSRTLPVFENQNVARRFSRRNQRVIKVPDGALLQTTSPYLQAKGITRLFIDGQVFSIGENPVAPAADS